MMTLDKPRADKPYAELHVSGSLSRADYERVLPGLEAVLDERDSLRLLVTLEAFEGWSPAALLDDLRFDIRHHDDFEALAVVGETRLQEYGTKLTLPFFSGETRWFDSEKRAREWLSGPPRSLGSAGVEDDDG